MEYSIVVPVHNEADNLKSQVNSFIHGLPSELRLLVKEILLVENGSTDKSLDVCRRLEKNYPSLVRVLSIPRGSYGEAIKHGMLQSRGTHLSILECDFLDHKFLSRSIALFQTADVRVIVGSKRHPEAIDERPVKRRVLTYIYNMVLLRYCLGYTGTDTHGLKSFQTAVAKELCKHAMTTDEIFQSEIILLAWRNGLHIHEIPVTIRETRCTSVSIRRRIPKVLHTVRELRASLDRYPLALRPGTCLSERGLKIPLAAGPSSEVSLPVGESNSISCKKEQHKHSSIDQADDVCGTGINLADIEEEIQAESAAPHQEAVGAISTWG